MAYFTQDFLEFFKELSANNNKDWFDANRKRYEKEVREPFKVFVGELIEAIKKESPDFSLEAKQAIFRINRDIRFSKDKTPYKIHMGAALINGGRKNWDTAGIYIQLDPEFMRIYSGLYAPSKDAVLRVRKTIATNPEKWHDIIDDKVFTKLFGKEINGKKNKVLPKDFKPVAEKEPLIFNKSWYVMAHIKPETILQNNLLAVCMKYIKAANQFNRFLG